MPKAHKKASKMNSPLSKMLMQEEEILNSDIEDTTISDPSIMEECFMALFNWLEMNLVKMIDEKLKNVPPLNKTTSTDGESEGSEGDRKSSTSSKKSQSSIASICKSLYNNIPKYDSDGNVQKLLDFIDKVKNYLNMAELTSSQEVSVISAKLIGTASLLW